MLTTTTLHLRLAGAARPLSPFSRLYSIAANRTTTTRLASTTSRPFLPRPQTPSSLPHRHASTTASSAAPPSASTSSTSSHLTWNEYLRLRKVRRYYNLSFSIGLGLTTTFLGMGFLAQQNLQQLGQTFFGLDPFMVMGILTVAFAGVGWLAGPLAGSAVFRTMYRQQAGEMALVSAAISALLVDAGFDWLEWCSMWKEARKGLCNGDVYLS